jgi:tripartite-type tricarboxylate transporter receptor subunit TctC
MHHASTLAASRRQTLQALLGAAAALAGAPAAAQDTGQPIRLIVPFAAGSSVDILARIAAERIAHHLGQPIVIDNKAGAGGGVGATAGAQAPANGQHLFFGTAGTHGINPSLYRKLGYDAAKDFDPVVAISASANVLVTHPQSGLRSVGDLVQQARAQPDKLSMGSGGNGTTPHLSGVLLNRMANVRTVHVPYKSGAILDVIAGRLDYSFESVPSALPHIQAGKVRALAVTDAQRVRMLPEVPAIAESYPGYQVMAWVAVFAPAGAPTAFIQRVNEATNKALAEPALQGRLAEIGSVPLGGTPDQLRQRVAFELQRWPDIIRAANVSID